MPNSTIFGNEINQKNLINTDKPDYCQKWLGKMDFLQSISDNHNVVILLFDTLTHRFIYMSDRENVLGHYDTEDFTSETGIDFYYKNIHPEHRSAALLIQLKILSFGIENAAVYSNKVVANKMSSFKKFNGEYIQFLQRFIPVEWDRNGQPLLYLLYGYDISHLVKPSVELIINASGKTIIWNYNSSTRKLDHSNQLSVQEKKILHLLAQGCGSKAISDKLFTSPHTIDTHRRNLLKKTNCIDTTAMITFAKMTGII